MEEQEGKSRGKNKERGKNKGKRRDKKKKEEEEIKRRKKNREEKEERKKEEGGGKKEERRRNKEEGTRKEGEGRRIRWRNVVARLPLKEHKCFHRIEQDQSFFLQPSTPTPTNLPPTICVL